MAVSCVPADLANAASCFCIADEQLKSAIEIYLLLQISGLSLTPDQLARNASCFCFDKKTAEAVRTYLLCSIANN